MCKKFFQRLFTKKQSDPEPAEMGASEVIEPIPAQPAASPAPKMVMAEKNGVAVKYPSVSAAVRDTGVNRGSISACLHGHRKSAGGYHWMYADPD